jgi:hypothetical protein
MLTYMVRACSAIGYCRSMHHLPDGVHGCITSVLLACRALVKKADGSQVWVNMPFPGSDTYLRDYTAGGGGGAIYRYKRVPDNQLPSTYGYNQVHAEHTGHIVLQMS